MTSPRHARQGRGLAPPAPAGAPERAAAARPRASRVPAGKRNRAGSARPAPRTSPFPTTGAGRAAQPAGGCPGDGAFSSPPAPSCRRAPQRCRHGARRCRRREGRSQSGRNAAAERGSPPASRTGLREQRLLSPGRSAAASVTGGRSTPRPGLAEGLEGRSRPAGSSVVCSSQATCVISQLTSPLRPCCSLTRIRTDRVQTLLKNCLSYQKHQQLKEKYI